MIKDIIKNRHGKNYTAQKVSYDASESSVVIPMLDEYSLLVRNDRVVDYTELKKTYSMDVNFGIYQDAQDYLIKGIPADTAADNVHNVLDLVHRFYHRILQETYDVKSTKEFVAEGHAKSVGSIKKLFLVSDLKLSNGKRSGTLCLNLMIRPGSVPFVIVGIEQSKNNGVRDDFTENANNIFNISDHI